MDTVLARLNEDGPTRSVWIRFPLTWPVSRSGRWDVRRTSLSLNRLLRLNRRQRSHVAKAIRDYVAIALAAGRGRIRPLIREAALKVTFFHGKRRVVDADNHMPKPLIDALIGRVIEDDRAAWLRIVPVEFDVDARDPRIEVEIREAAAPSPSET